MKRTGTFLLGLLLGIVVMLRGGRQLLREQTPSTPLIIPVPQLGTGKQEVGSGMTALGEVFGKYQVIDAILQEGYYDSGDIDVQAMHENAIKGYVDALGDPYTVYLSAEENQLFDEEMQGSQNFEGIGAVITKKEDGVLIEEVLKGFPASKAGLRHLDLILEVDGVSTQDMNLFEAVEVIRGPKGSEVILTVYREADNTIDEYTVTRDAVNVPSVDGELLDIAGKNILYMEISIIGEDTLLSLRELVTAYKPDVDGVILDLRGNGGGYLPLAVNVASYFLPRNEMVTTAKYTTLPDEVYRSKGYGDFEGKPLVVLVDGLSASAAEIIAGALDQRADAVLVGTQTFGKGSIQTLDLIEDGASLKYTIGKRYLPNDTNVDKIGVTPDIDIEFDMSAYLSGDVDNQLEAAKEAMGDLF